MEQGDETAFDEMLLELQKVGNELEAMEGEERFMYLREQEMAIAQDLLPQATILMILLLIILICSSTYFFVLAVNPSEDVLALIRTTGRKLLPMIGVDIWAFLRSFLWIPIIGIIPAIILIPRFIFAGVIFLKEGTSIKESVSLSYGRTKGHWWMIVGNMVGLMICLWIVLVIFILLAQFTGPLAPLLVSVFGYALAACAAVFIVFLAQKVTSPAKQGETV